MEDPLVPTESSPLVKNGSRLFLFLCFALMLTAGILAIIEGIKPEKEATLVIGVSALILTGTSAMFVKWMADGTIEEQKMTRVIVAQIIMMLLFSASLIACFYGPSAPEEYVLGGYAMGMPGKGGSVKLELNGQYQATASAGAGACAPFLFPTTLVTGSKPKVTIKTQPHNAMCTVGALGTLTKDKNDLVVSCKEAYSIGGSVDGLTADGLVLTNNGKDPLAVKVGERQFTFKEGVSAPSFAYDVEVMQQPKDQKCSASNNKGTASAAVTNVKISCTA